MDNVSSSSLNETIREEATASVLKDQVIRRKKLSAIEFVKAVGRRFIEYQLDNFPNLCDITRMQNKLKHDELKESGIKGKYTESYGWSESGDFKFEYEIPSELHLFMINLVYKDFWSNENEKVWRKFMHLILTGNHHTDMDALMWAKAIYGSNSQKLSVTAN